MSTVTDALSIVSKVIEPLIDQLETALGELKKIKDDLKERQTIDTSGTDEMEEKYGE